MLTKTQEAPQPKKPNPNKRPRQAVRPAEPFSQQNKVPARVKKSKVLRLKGAKPKTLIAPSSRQERSRVLLMVLVFIESLLSFVMLARVVASSVFFYQLL
jgi:hypothetical protein